MLYRRGILAGAAAAFAAAAAPPPQPRSLRVPFDHFVPDSGSFALPYLVDGDVDRMRPTIIIVGDGQQFYIRPERLPDFRALFGPDVNIVGLPGRSFAPELQVHLGAHLRDDWARIYAVLRYAQWSEDIDALRTGLLGAGGKVLLYGASGGGRLVHEHLTRAGHVARAYTEAAVFPALDAEIGLLHDHFWSEISVEEQTQLSRAIAARPDQRPFYAQLLQRQNFFVPLDGLPPARKRLIADIAAGDGKTLADYSHAYQIDAIHDLLASPAGLGIIVREYEFIEPLMDRVASEGPVLLPDLEVSANIAAPLLALRRAGKLPPTAPDLAALTRCEAEVTVVAARYDHTADYRSQIALASHYPRHELLLLDDDHTFHRYHAARDARRALLGAWPYGFGDVRFQAALRGLAGLRWREVT
jgi:hypothetical protein